jgi:hypothetical protein
VKVLRYWLGPFCLAVLASVVLSACSAAQDSEWRKLSDNERTAVQAEANPDSKSHNPTIEAIAEAGYTAEALLDPKDYPGNGWGVTFCPAGVVYEQCMSTRPLDEHPSVVVALTGKPKNNVFTFDTAKVGVRGATYDCNAPQTGLNAAALTGLPAKAVADQTVGWHPVAVSGVTFDCWGPKYPTPAPARSRRP